MQKTRIDGFTHHATRHHFATSVAICPAPFDYRPNIAKSSASIIVVLKGQRLLWAKVEFRYFPNAVVPALVSGEPELAIRERQVVGPRQFAERQVLAEISHSNSNQPFEFNVLRPQK
jgi:hypothetical protein